MPIFNNIPGAIKQELLAPVDLSESPALLRAQIRNIGNSAARSASFKSFFRQEFRSILHPRENGLLGMVATRKTDDIDISIIGNPIPKIIFGGTDVDVAVVFNQDAFRIVLEKDVSEDGTSVRAWILAVVPYAAFDKLPFGGFLIYLIRRVDDILAQTSALSRYETKLTKLPVNSIGIGRSNATQERPEEADIATNKNPAPVDAPAAPVAPVAQPKAAPVKVAEAPEPEPEPVADEVAEAPVADEPEPVEVDKEDENYRAAASFSLLRQLTGDKSTSTTYEPVRSYAAFSKLLVHKATEVRRFVKSLNTSATNDGGTFSFRTDKDFSTTFGLSDGDFLVELHLPAQLDEGKPVRAIVSVYNNVTSETKQLGTWTWQSNEYGKKSAFALIEQIHKDLASALQHTDKVFPDSQTTPETAVAATEFQHILPPSDDEASDYLDNHLIHWHSGMDDVYALSSNWCTRNKHDVPRDTVEGALAILSRYVGQPNFAEDREELETLIGYIKEALDEADRFAAGDRDSGLYSNFYNPDGSKSGGSNVAEAASADVDSLISELRALFADGESYYETIDEIQAELDDTSVPAREKIRSLTLLIGQMSKDRDEHWVDSETGWNDEEIKKASDVNTDLLGKAVSILRRVIEVVRSESEVTAATYQEPKEPKIEHPDFPTEIQEPKAKLAIDTYKKKLEEIRKKTGKPGTNESAYKKIEVKEDPKVKQDKVEELERPDAEATLPTTVGDRAKDSQEEAPKAEKPKDAAKLPKGFEAKAAAVARKDIPYEGYTIEKRASTRDESIAVFDVTRPDGSHCHEATSLPKAKEYIDKVVKRLGKPATAAADFDQDYTADQPVDLERNDMVTDFSDTDKNLNNPDEVAEGAKEEVTEEPVAEKPAAVAPAEDTKIDLNVALKFRVVLPVDTDSDEVAVPGKLTEVLAALKEEKLPVDTVVFITSGKGLKTLVVSKSSRVHSYASDLLVPERAEGTLEDKTITSALDAARKAKDDRAESLRLVEVVFDAFSTIIEEDAFVAENFDDMDDDASYKMPDDADEIREYLLSYTKSSSETDGAEVKTEDPKAEADAAFASALCGILGHRENPVEAAAMAAAIVNHYGSDALSAFSALESTGVFASARNFPVMETKWYKRGDNRYAAYHMSVASEDQATLMYIPRIGAYAVASLQELQEEEARG